MIQYIFEPFPWHFSAVEDLALAGERVLCGYLIYRALLILLGHRDVNRKVLFIIFFLYLTLTGIFAVGTTNWGTAARHHVLDLGLLLLASCGTDKSRKNKFKSVKKMYLRRV